TKELIGEHMKAETTRFKEITGNEKVCLVVEMNSGYRPANKEERELVAAEIKEIAKAVALIVSSPVTRILVNLFTGFRPPEYPVKIFSNEADAINWIKQYV